MRRILAGLVLVALPVVGIVATATPAAAKSFDLESLTTRATVHPDATMTVIEDITYHFSGGPFTVGIRSFAPRSRSQISQFEVSDENGTALGVTPPTASISGEWEWSFAPTSDADRTFTITYTVVDAVAVGPDVGELYWQFLGSDHQGVGTVAIRISLPGGYPAATPATPADDTSVVRAWAHGPPNGVVAILPPTGEPPVTPVTLDVTDVPAETFVEARVAVPSGAFTVTPSGEPRLPTILSQERQFISDREAKDRRALAGNIAAPIAALLGLGAFLVVWRRWGKEPKLPGLVGDYWREPLDDPPAVAVGNLSFGTVGSAAFSSTVVDLAQRGYLTISEEHHERLGPDKTVYRFRWAGKPTDTLLPYERQLLEELFRGQSETTSEEFATWARTEHEAATTFWQGWKAAVRKEIDTRGYLETGRTAVWMWWALIVALLVVATIVCFALGGWLAVLPLGATIAVIALGTTLRRRTPKGAEKAEEAEALKRFLRDFSTLDEAPVESLAIWERYLVAAVALGVAGALVRGLAAKLPEVASSPNFAAWYVGGVGMARLDAIGQFGTSFATTAVGAMAPSTTGSGGGFSGGGGGGGGGGGFGAR